MKIEKLIIGNTYYIPHGTWNYKKGKLVKILDSKKVLLSDSKGNVLRCSINKLHTVPYKAVLGYKARERVKQQMKEMEERKQGKTRLKAEKRMKAGKSGDPTKKSSEGETSQTVNVRRRNYIWQVRNQKYVSYVENQSQKYIV